MNQKSKKYLIAAGGFLVAFVLWTAAVCCMDVQAIGPEGSPVGLATLNQGFHRLAGVHMSLYHITDWLSLLPVAFALGFAMLGLTQWIKRKHLLKVDRSLLLLGGFYIIVMAVYLFFEIVVINRRPVLIGGVLEASYPSSTTVLVMCIMPTAVMQLSCRTGSPRLRCLTAAILTAFTVFMVTGRLVSGVHWLSDIIGGALLSAGLVTAYRAATIDCIPQVTRGIMSARKT